MADVHQFLEPSKRSFAERLADAELKSLKLLVEVLESYDQTSEEDFANIIDSVLSYRFQQAELAQEFKVSTGTISRWKAGKSCPPPYARGVIVDRIREMLASTIVQRQSINRLRIVG